MPSIIIVEKLGNIKSVQLKNYDESELYKKAGFKTADGFKCHTNWTIEIESKKYVICVYGKTNGKANQENKYEFPPPIDNTLFFGNCVIVKKLESDPLKVMDLTDSGWNAIYETLYGGFEDLGDEDSDEEDDSDEDPSLPRTKNGYVKDGFVVDDDEVEDDEDEEDEDEDVVDDEEEVYVKKTSAKAKAKAKNTKTNAIKSIFDLKSIEELATPSQENYLGCTSELVEEEYV
jgi:hypothetical protein